MEFFSNASRFFFITEIISLHVFAPFSIPVVKFVRFLLLLSSSPRPFQFNSAFHAWQLTWRYFSTKINVEVGCCSCCSCCSCCKIAKRYILCLRSSKLSHLNHTWATPPANPSSPDGGRNTGKVRWEGVTRRHGRGWRKRRGKRARGEKKEEGKEGEEGKKRSKRLAALFNFFFDIYSQTGLSNKTILRFWKTIMIFPFSGIRWFRFPWTSKSAKFTKVPKSAITLPIFSKLLIPSFSSDNEHVAKIGRFLELLWFCTFFGQSFTNTSFAHRRLFSAKIFISLVKENFFSTSLSAALTTIGNAF